MKKSAARQQQLIGVGRLAQLLVMSLALCSCFSLAQADCGPTANRLEETLGEKISKLRSDLDGAQFDLDHLSRCLGPDARCAFVTDEEWSNYEHPLVDWSRAVADDMKSILEDRAHLEMLKGVFRASAGNNNGQCPTVAKQLEVVSSPQMDQIDQAFIKIGQAQFCGGSKLAEPEWPQLHWVRK